MNSWNNVLQLLGWFVYAALIIFAILVAWGILLFIVGRVRAFRKRHTTPFTPKPSFKHDDYMAEATVVGRSMYKDKVFQNEKIEAFRSGAHWGWVFFSRP